jgi:organic radical activating enzyme
VFLRTFGCNFSCRGFGLPLGERTTEPDEIAKNIEQYETYKDLPIVKFGCDSYASWHPKFKQFSNVYETDKLAIAIADLLPHKEWNDEHLVITGGEPLLAGWQRSFTELLDQPDMELLKEITFETNGTQKLMPGFKEYLKDWATAGREITFSVSAKLSCSGEDEADAIKPEIVVEYEDIGIVFLKFVVATEDDAHEALEAYNKYQEHGFSGHCYLMPVGGTTESYNMNNKAVAEFAMNNGLRYSDRLQVPLFKNAWGT